MTQTRKKAAITAGLRRRSGASPETRARMTEHMQGEQWWGRCRRCGAILKGTPTQLDHMCGKGESR